MLSAHAAKEIYNEKLDLLAKHLLQRKKDKESAGKYEYHPCCKDLITHPEKIYRQLML